MSCLLVYGCVTLSTIGAAFYLWHNCQPFFLPLDDAYITLHNAEVIWLGQDPNYAVPASIGTTSPVHLALVALAMTVLPPVTAGLLVSVLGAILYLQAVAALALNVKMPMPAVAMMTAIAALTGFTPYHLFNGLETSWAMAAVAWAILLALEDPPAHKLALLAGTLPFIRPELGVLSLLLLLRQAWQRLHQQPHRSAALAAIGIDGLLAVAAALPWFLWPILQTGQVLPGTIVAKIAFFAEGNNTWYWKLSVMSRAIKIGVGFLFINIIFMKRCSLNYILLLYIIIIIIAFACVFPGGLGQNYARYSCVFVPICVWALCDIWARRRRLIAGTLLALSCAAAVIGVPASLQAIEREQAIVRDSFRAADWAQAHIPAGAPVLIHDAGAIAFASRLTLIDLVGLKTPWAVADHLRWTLPTAGRLRGVAVSAIAKQGGAAYAIILHDRDQFWGALARQMREQGWGLEVIRPRDGAFGYDIYRLTAPATGGS